VTAAPMPIKQTYLTPTRLEHCMGKRSGVDYRTASLGGAQREDPIDKRQIWVQTVRWIARVWSAATVVLLLAFILGEGFHPSGPKDLLGAPFFPVGISVGMMLVWRKENLGGSMTAGTLLTFSVVRRAMAGTYPKGWAWLAFAAPGFLFLLSSQLSRRSRMRAA